MTDRPRRSRLWTWIGLIAFLILLGVLYAPLKDFGAELFRLWA